MPKNWEFIKTSKFERQYLGKTLEIQEKIDNTLEELQVADDPKSLGKKKKPLGFYAIELSDSHRLAYNVGEKSNTISLLRVCNHKDVYQRN